ncbi:MAG: hypothetical protein WC224_07205 [Sphaerochaetaceae bacterium]
MHNKDLEYIAKKFAIAYTTHTIHPIRRVLAKDFSYASMWVLDEITSKRAYLKYLKGKLKTIKKSVGDGATVSTEIVFDTRFNTPYLLLTQKGAKGLLVFSMEKDKLKRADLCIPELYSYSHQRK